MIRVEEADAARAEPLTEHLHLSEVELGAPYLAEMVRSELVERYGEEAYTRGIEVYTSLDSRLQTAA